MGRYNVYSYDDITPEVEEPTVVYTFDYNEADHAGTFVLGSTVSSPILDSGASAVNNFYVGYNITNTDTAETRKIASYNGTTKVCTLDSDFGSMTVGDAFTINDPSTWYFAHMQPSINFDPTNYVIIDKNTRAYVGIYDYDSATKMASLTNFFPPTSALV